MKNFLILMSFLLLGFIGKAQSIYIDAVGPAAQALAANSLKNKQEDTNDNLTAIQRGQLLVTSQLQVANDLQDKIHKGLTQVSGTLNNAMTVKEIYSNTQDMYQNISKAAQLAVSNPVLTAFAVKSGNEFKRRAVQCATEVSRILTGGDLNMMDAGERQSLLNMINDEVRILNACAYMVYFNMYWAKQQGIWNSINPFAKWKNQDLAIINDVRNKLNTMKNIK